MVQLFNPKPISEFSQSTAGAVKYVFSDLDDTITTHGRLEPQTYQALCDLAHAGIKLIIVTGGPAGWCDCIAKMWPVHAVVGEGGAFYMYKDPQTEKLVTREFVAPSEREEYASKIQALKEKLLNQFPALCFSSDQFSRLYDLAIELSSLQTPNNTCTPQPIGVSLEEVLSFLHAEGLTTKISSIHINAAWGMWDKLSSTQTMARELMGIDLADIIEESAFIGDSLNDELMFKFFKHTVGVANLERYSKALKYAPEWITSSERGAGFAEFAQVLLCK